MFEWNDLFWNEPGNHECTECGVEVKDFSTHLEWHNKLEARLNKEQS